MRRAIPSLMLVLFGSCLLFAEEYKGVKVNKVSGSVILIEQGDKKIQIYATGDTRYYDAEGNEVKKATKIVKKGAKLDVTTTKLDAKKLLGKNAPKGEVEVAEVITQVKDEKAPPKK